MSTTDPNFGFSGPFIPIIGSANGEPAYASVQQNVQEALAFQATHTTDQTIQWLYERFRNNSDGHLAQNYSWDYKQIWGAYADFGNYNYGVVLKALGFSDLSIYLGAGFAQQVSDGKSLGGAVRGMLSNGSYGDNPEDTVMIRAGISATVSAGLSDGNGVGEIGWARVASSHLWGNPYPSEDVEGDAIAIFDALGNFAGYASLSNPPHSTSEILELFRAIKDWAVESVDSSLRAAGRIESAIAAAKSNINRQWQELGDSIGTNLESMKNWLDDLLDKVQKLPSVGQSLVLQWPLGDDNQLSWLRDLKSAEESYIVPGPGSPIVLDLDGDGVEVVALASGTYFDLEADGFAQRTGWVTGGDGFLVWDRNGNGEIDNGRELFGNHTLLANGSEAANGFAALVELDVNGNGILNSDDSAWSNLRVWRDANQNGLTDAGELLAMSAAGVQSIGTGYVDWGNYDPTGTGNPFHQIGSFTTTGGASQSAIDVWFANDPLNRIETDWVVESNAVLALPDLTGYGLVHGLRQAMARDSTGVLQSRVQAFVSAQTDTARDAAVDQILLAWADSENATYTGLPDQPEVPVSYVSPQIVATLEKFSGSPIQIGGAPNLINMSQVKAFLTAAYGSLHDWVYGQLAVQTFLKTDLDLVQIGFQSITGVLVHDFTALVGSLQAGIAADHETGVIRAVNVLRGIASAGTQVTSSEWGGLKTALGRFDERIDWVLESRGLTTVMGGSGPDWLSHLTVGGGAPHEISNASAGGDGADTVFGGGGADVLFGGQGNDQLNDSTGSNVFDGGRGDDLLLGGPDSDSYYFRRDGGSDVIIDQGSSPSSNAVDRVLLGREVAPLDVSIWRDRDNLYLQLAESGDRLTVTGHFHDQAYYPEMKIEQLVFGDGTVWGEEVFALAKFAGTSAADSIYGNLEANVLVGLGGDDYLVGDAGDDTYEFSTGFGADTIYETGGSVDMVRFTGGITPSDIQISRDAADLFLTLTASGDRIRIYNYFYDPVAKIEQVQFSNGTAWNSAILDAANYVGTGGYDALLGTLANETFYGLDGDDWIAADGGDDAVYAGAGDDIVSGWDGNDLINGAAGNDSLYGEEGNDTLSGGAGADTLDGGAGTDTLDYSAETGDVTAELWRGSVLNDGTGGVDTIAGFERLIGGSGNDLLSGDWLSNIVDGRGGNDRIFGQEANDSLLGGTGDDTLVAGAGADYVDGGAGSDTLDFSGLTGNVRAEIWDGSVLSDATGSTDQILNIENLTGGNGADLLSGDWRANRVEGGSGNDDLWGQEGDDTLVGGAGNDTLHAGSGIDTLDYGAMTGAVTAELWRGITLNDGANGVDTFSDAENLVGGAGNDLLSGNNAANRVEGGAGNDDIWGQEGNDTLAGGVGADTLHGGSGADVYKLARGDGADTVIENDTASNVNDVASFAAGIAFDQLWFRMVGSGDHDLEASVIGTNDRFVFQNWDLGDQYHVEQFKTTYDNKTLLDSQVQALVSAMSNFAPPALGETTMSQSLRNSLETPLGAWQ